MKLSNRNILDSSNNLSPPIEKLFEFIVVPSSNRNKEESWDLLIQKIHEQQDAKFKNNSYSLLKVLSIAASFLLIIGLAYIKYSKVEINTSNGQMLTIKLPDKSEVQINACSKIYFSRFWLLNKREVNFEGEAFFKVRKGKTFTVNTFSLNRIEVLGTQFNVYARNNNLKVTCFEGKVKIVSSKGQSKEIPAGFESRLVNDVIDISQYSHNTLQKPLWTNGEFYFEATPLSEVIAEVMRQYPVKIKTTNFDPAKRFYTGYFTNKNLIQALELITIPMNLKYDFVNDSLIQISFIQE